MNHLDHSFFQQRLSAYVDGELEPSVRTQVQEHLRDCAECRDRLKEIEKLGDFVAQESGLAESDYWEQAAQRIEHAIAASQPKVVDLPAERARRRASPWWWRAPAIAASVLFLGYIAFNERNILRDEVVAPPQPSAIRPAPSEKPAEAKKENEVPSSGTPSPAVRNRQPAPPSPEPKQENAERLAADQEAKPEPTPAERPGQQQSGLSGQENTELDKSIVTISSPDLIAKPQAEVAPAAKTPDETTAGNAPPAEKVVSDSSEQNYRARNREKGAFILRDTLRVTTDLYSVKQSGETGLSELQNEELTYWRSIRDSLVHQAALIRQQDSSPIGQALKFAQAPSRSGLRTALSGDDPRQRMENQTEAGLLEAWYRVCLLTSDSTETSQGISFIEKVAADKESDNRISAQDFLKKLGRH